jgi:beta-1,4-mannosyl-glycoprotein beta-1,4-N-acetylglucosaminyltransferase
MKIYDCLIYFNEDLLLDLRFNYLDQYVEKFVVVESTYTHSGKKRKLLFDINKFSTFKKKIIYLVLDKEPDNIFTVHENDTINEINSKLMLNGFHREHLQRNYITKGLEEADSDDMIIISDADEIPNLESVDLSKIKNKLIFFNQFYYYYKLNLKLDNYIWCGSKACKKKNLISPQWIRSIKDKVYPLWRLDVLFHKKKYSDIFKVKNGGWHFSKLNTPEEIVNIMKSYSHYREYDLNPLGVNKIKEIIAEKKAIYNLNVDQTQNKFDFSQELTISEIDEMPSYVFKNIEKYKDWIA